MSATAPVATVGMPGESAVSQRDVHSVDARCANFNVRFHQHPDDVNLTTGRRPALVLRQSMPGVTLRTSALLPVSKKHRAHRFRIETILPRRSPLTLPASFADATRVDRYQPGEAFSSADGPISSHQVHIQDDPRSWLRLYLSATADAGNNATVRCGRHVHIIDQYYLIVSTALAIAQGRVVVARLDEDHRVMLDDMCVFAPSFISRSQNAFKTTIDPAIKSENIAAFNAFVETIVFAYQP